MKPYAPLSTLVSAALARRRAAHAPDVVTLLAFMSRVGRDARLTTLTLLLLSGATAAHAQGPTTNGWSLGGGVGLSRLATDGNGGWGPEASARIAYGTGRTLFFVRARYGAYETDHPIEDDSWGLWSWDLGLRLHLIDMSSRGWTPYLEVAGSARRGSVEAYGPIGPRREWALEGGAFALGSGVVWFVREALAVDVGLSFARGWLPNPRDDDPWITSTGTLAVGVQVIIDRRGP